MDKVVIEVNPEIIIHKVITGDNNNNINLNLSYSLNLNKTTN